MLDFLKKIPAGTFLVPLLLSAVLYTLWPNLLRIGGLTESLFGGTSIPFLIGMITFCSGFAIDIKSLGLLFRRHGILILVKILICLGVSILYMTLFGQKGIGGISALAFTVALCSMNPSVYLAVVRDYGIKMDQAAFGLTALFSIPAFPMIAYAFSGSRDVDWLPIISTIIPLILGIILGNLDPKLSDLFSTGIAVLTPILGWNLGQGMNLISGFRSGLSGILLVMIFYLMMLPLLLVDRKVLKNDGIVGLAMMSSAGSSTAFPALIVMGNPELAGYIPGAVAQILTLAVVTIILTPLLSRLYYQSFVEVK